MEPATELTIRTARARTGQKDMYQPFKRDTNGPIPAAAIAAPIPPHTTGYDLRIRPVWHRSASFPHAHVRKEAKEPCRPSRCP